MTIFTIIILAVVQGVTEFLPVSSSGHLVVAQSLFQSLGWGSVPEKLEVNIALHVGTEYTVYAIGFCPGFPYLGYLPPPLCGVPRLESPRLRVEPGSVGLTGRQTGIYTEARPGGWSLVGRVPLTLVVELGMAGIHWEFVALLEALPSGACGVATTRRRVNRRSQASFCAKGASGSGRAACKLRAASERNTVSGVPLR